MDAYQLKKIINGLISQLEQELENEDTSVSKTTNGKWQLDTSIFSYLGIKPPDRYEAPKTKIITPLRQEKLANKKELAEQLRSENDTGIFSNIKQMFSKSTPVEQGEV
jgi:hypothetical protein